MKIKNSSPFNLSLWREIQREVFSFHYLNVVLYGANPGLQDG
jgi:hypothetical protein